MIGAQMYGQAVDWNDAAVTTLKTMWAAGGSASQIAIVIPNATRNAVLGKVMRLKLPPRGRVAAKPRPMKASVSAPAPREKAPRPAPIEKEPTPQRRRSFAENLAEKIAVAEDEQDLSPILKGEAPDGTGVKFSALNSATCHWPRGDPLHDDFEFCGAAAIKDMPYCARHTRLAYAPPKARAAANNWATHRADTKS